MIDYEREFSEISDTLVTAYQNWEIWWFYKSQRPKYVNIMNKYLIYFSNSIYAHRTAFIMAIWCLIDSNRLSLFSLYKKMCADNSIDDVMKKEIDDKINSISHIIKGITIIRHNVVAHISNKIDFDETLGKANLKYDDFRDIIVELGNIFNLLRIAKGKNVLGFWLKGRTDKPDELIENDLERLLNDLIKYSSGFK